MKKRQSGGSGRASKTGSSTGSTKSARKREKRKALAEKREPVKRYPSAAAAAAAAAQSATARAVAAAHEGSKRSAEAVEALMSDVEDEETAVADDAADGAWQQVTEAELDARADAALARLAEDRRKRYGSRVAAELEAAELEESKRASARAAAASGRALPGAGAAEDDGKGEWRDIMDLEGMSSDEEAQKNTIGKVPMEWYRDYDHIGYDLSGKRIMRKDRGDGLDAFIASKDDPNYWRTVYDAYNDEEVVLSNRELVLLHNMMHARFPHAEFDPYPEYVDFVTGHREKMPLSGAPIPKRRFLPSKWERMKIKRIQKGIAEGRIKPHKRKEEPKVFMLWDDDEQISKRGGSLNVAAPRVKLPDHKESYRPPDEYLLTEEESARWEAKAATGRKRAKWIPKKHDSLRHVRPYEHFAAERFNRCLDLYLCPRVRKTRRRLKVADVLPTLPKPKELKPFPNTLALEFVGHEGRVRSISFSPDGQWLLSAGDDCTLRLWEVDTARLVRSWRLEDVIQCVAWNPVYDIAALAVAHTVLLLQVGVGGAELKEQTAAKMTPPEEAEEAAAASAAPPSVLPWTLRDDGCVQLQGTFPMRSVVWHPRGDYFASVSPRAGPAAVLVHRLSAWKSQKPFRKNRGQVQRVAFHPTKPIFFVATQLYVRIFHLQQQRRLKVLQSSSKWISSLAVHPSGDHVLIGSYDRRVCWFDLDLSRKPFRTLKYHRRAVRQVVFHGGYPLMASASDDGCVHVFHARVFDDLITDPLIVPVKILRGHSIVDDLGILDLAFHPSQPWLATAGADSVIRLFQDV